MRQLDHRVVEKLLGVAEIGQLVFGGMANQICCVLVQHAGLTDVVQANIGHGDVFLQYRAVAAPLRNALAMDEGVVGQVQDVLRRVIGGQRGHGLGGHHICPTASGIS